jgi:hypothetical protein
VSFEVDEISRLQFFGNLYNSYLNQSQDEVYPVKENFDILVASCRQIFLRIRELDLTKIGNKKFNTELENNHLLLLHFETPYFSAEYKSSSNYLSQIKDSLVFFQDLLVQKKNSLGNKLMKFGQAQINLPWQKSKEESQEIETKEPTEIQKLQNHIAISLHSVDNLLEKMSETNWSKTDVVKLVPINELLVKLNVGQRQELQEILTQRQDWKVSELLLTIHSILQKDLI